ncbi:hypothetical protein, partial [Bacillus subtilis]|uniref:hypothetical protein n=1 Tax=Bacillus subtilis TaxID=1423 RepID=UPI003C16FBB1
NECSDETARSVEFHIALPFVPETQKRPPNGSASHGCENEESLSGRRTDTKTAPIFGLLIY